MLKVIAGNSPCSGKIMLAQIHKPALRTQFLEIKNLQVPNGKETGRDVCKAVAEKLEEMFDFANMRGLLPQDGAVLRELRAEARALRDTHFEAC